MKKFLICLTTLFLFGCSENIREEQQQNNKPKTYYSTSEYKTIGIEIEGHQYIIFDGVSCGTIIHAAHCPCHDKK